MIDGAQGEIPALQNYLGKAGRVLRELGAFALMTRGLRRLTHPLIEVGSITFFVRGLGEPAQRAAAPGFTVRQLGAADREALLFGSESSWETLRARFAKGDLCFGALDQQGRAAHTRWVTLKGAGIPELQMNFIPGEGAAYFYDGYTRPEARRHGIDAVVRAAIFETLRGLGRDRVFSYVRNDNPDGRRAAGRCQEAIATVRYVRPFRSKPLVFGADLKQMASQLQEPHGRADDDPKGRAADWRRWFEGWLKEPLAKRSIGFHELPEDAFKAMAGHLSSTLHLDPSCDIVLDLGCDSALVTRHVAPRCARLVGVDFIPGMLVDAKRARGAEASISDPLFFAGADGRALPFPSHTFTKAYCTGVIHTLPSQEDGLRVIIELVRVLKPGGQVLIAAVPDARKRGRARRLAFRLGGLKEKAHIIGAMALPPAVRRLARRVLPWVERDPLRYLEYDLRRMQTLLEGRGLRCAVIDYPEDFWSRDFKETRSNLFIELPPHTKP